MKPSLNEVKLLESRLLGLEMEIKLMSNDLAIVQYNIVQLLQMEKTYVYNINFLKKDKIIAVASEYKESVDNLRATRESLKTYRELEIDFKNKMGQNEIIHEEFMEEYTRKKKALENEKVILIFDSKRKKK